MRKKALLNAAASSLLLGITTVGCTGSASMMARAGTAQPAAKQGQASATLAEKALAKRDVAAALAAAETAVAAKPDDAGYRLLLGRAYLADGRFVSAETALSDAMTLGNTDARTIVSLALAKVALSNSAGAREVLAVNMDHVPATDYGLAMAMAGDTDEAIRILSAAAQEPEATAKTRQNLAYAYALAGQWREARLMAAQDLDALAATQRVVSWAQNAEAGAEPQRVAALIGTQIRADDAGMPVRLALASSAPIQMAQAEVAPAPEATSAEQTTESASPDVPFLAEPEAPVRAAEFHPTPVARAVTMMRKAALFTPLMPSATSNWVVQLGAYDSVGVAKGSWQRMARANGHLAKFPVSYSTANVQGRLYHRLAVGGFGDRASAYQMCRTIRSQGGACFIRAAAPVKLWAAVAKSKRQQFASR
ncbi:pilus assembly protein TadD [Sphingobium sp. SCG-1]|uniref:SPOR domain-containing protein n=1 Tax=Sphingobium sp. SCG-1 TaxID=2072936 RepID=UPI000CD69A47|nr:SPOR domain-containing protein [Sphingobium sp. SCG-1]AUW59163.1 pilus assembly protein TadD [Sphingobium sp. SCG-1]